MNTPTATPPALAIGRYRAHFSATEPPRFNDFPGNAWRGALGHALKRAVCVTRQTECRSCPLYTSCLYPYFWDTPPHPGAEKMRKYQTAPHPFVLLPTEDAPLCLEFRLFGQANRHLALFVHALERAAAGPRGIAGNVMALTRVEQTPHADLEQWQDIYTPAETHGAQLQALPARSVTPESTAPTGCTLEFLTPVRVKRDGKHVGPQDFTFADLFGNLLRRISMIRSFHTDTPLEADFSGLMAAARQIPARCALTWREHSRYSRRQEAAQRIGGVVGTITLEQVDLTPFWPYLWLGQFTLAGSGATMGLGRYRIHRRDLCPTASLQASPPLGP